ncbi:hepatitis A virus cellular receptor 1 homolog [Molossus molossus]|uniref:hepatitis A virus cellular receptor 1 homolog n=1 Tax=Molossus molossus TaxID=27622 RepID=UPI001745CD9A|nr:hepatitis A virus cellular receptor 1 homolog [Molossus molossus]
MHPWVAFTGLILLWTDAVDSQAHVTGVVGQPVTLPCTYSTASEITSMCWGRGGCATFKCSNQLIWTDGYRVTFRKDKRYDLHGIIPRGNVSLTIEDAAESDSGTYCCHVQGAGWFNDLKIHVSLVVKPAPPEVTSAPTSPKAATSAPTTPAATQNLKTAPPEVTGAPASPKAATSAPTVPAHWQNFTTAPPKVTKFLTSPQVSNSAPTTPALKQKFETGHRCSSITYGLHLCSYNCSTHAETQDSKEPLAETSPKATAVRYQARDGICFENDLYNMN